MSLKLLKTRQPRLRRERVRVEISCLTPLVALRTSSASTRSSRRSSLLMRVTQDAVSVPEASASPSVSIISPRATLRERELRPLVVLLLKDVLTEIWTLPEHSVTSSINKKSNSRPKSKQSPRTPIPTSMTCSPMPISLLWVVMGFGRRRAMRKWSRGSTLSSERTRRMRICRRLSPNYSRRNACRKTTPRATDLVATTWLQFWLFSNEWYTPKESPEKSIESTSSK